MPTATSITVLIADDHPIFRRGLCEIIAGDASLQLAGEAGDGEQAWRLMQRLLPTVAVLDIHMPKYNGIELARFSLQHRLPSKLIILTMDSDEALLAEALALEVAGYLLKETAVTDLLDAIRRVAGGGCFISPAFSGALVRHNAARKVLQRQEPGLAQLTSTERQILKLIAADHTSKEIAGLLSCSIRTVETHRQNISRKLELSGSHSLLRFAFNHKELL